jgi:hypothetical protein
MKQKSGPGKAPAEQVLKDIRRQTRRQYSAEEKIRIVLEGLRGWIRPDWSGRNCLCRETGHCRRNQARFFSLFRGGGQQGVSFRRWARKSPDGGRSSPATGIW